jgi:hypothetical protein
MYELATLSFTRPLERFVRWHQLPRPNEALNLFPGERCIGAFLVVATELETAASTVAPTPYDPLIRNHFANELRCIRGRFRGRAARKVVLSCIGREVAMRDITK